MPPIKCPMVVHPAASNIPIEARKIFLAVDHHRINQTGVETAISIHFRTTQSAAKRYRLTTPWVGS